MARPRPRPRTPTSGALTRPQPAVAVAITDWRRDAIVVRLTARLHALVAETGRRSAEAAVTIGTQLARIRDRLPHGQWRQWLDDNASFGRSTAANYIELSAFAARAPADFDRLRHLGPGKLYVLASVPAQRIRKLAPGKLVAIPGVAHKKTIEHMTTVELHSIVGDIAIPEPPRPPIAKVVQGVRFKVAALGAATTEMLARAREVSPSDAAEIRGELEELLARIDAAFEG